MKGVKMQLLTLGNVSKTHLGICIGTFLLFGFGFNKNTLHINLGFITIFLYLNFYRWKI